MSLREERLRKAAERQRGYRRRRKELEEAEVAAIAKGETFELPPKGPKGHHLVPYQFTTGHEPQQKGSRQRLSHDFINAFHQHFLERGHTVFDELLADEPATYARLLASLEGREEVIAELKDDRKFLREEITEARKHRGESARIASEMLETMKSMALGRLAPAPAPQPAEVIRTEPVAHERESRQ